MLPGQRVAAKETLYADYDARTHGMAGRSPELSDNCYKASAQDIVAGLYKLNAVDQQLETAWFQPLNL